MKSYAIAFVLVILSVVIALSVGASTKPKKYNLIIVSFDALQAKHLHRFGYFRDTTPNLDKFLDSSYVFSHAVSPSSWTVPAHMSIFTSLYPSEHKVVNKFSSYDMKTQKGTIANLKQLSPSVMTLAEILKQAGYKTAGFTGDAGVGAQFGFNQGFDTYYDAEAFGGFDGSVPRSIQWLKDNKNEPFFLFLHGYDFHGQHVPTEGYDFRYVDTPYTGTFTGSKQEQGMLREKGLQDGKINMSESDVEFWRSVYDEKISRADTEFQKFVTEIEKLGLMENTVFILMSDHGTELYEHKRFDHGFSLYSELVNVLFAMRIPGQTKGDTISQLVSTIDILPTALSLLGVNNPVPNQVKGIDLSPAFAGQTVARNIFMETDYRLYTFKRAIQSPDGWKFILTLNGGEKELYNLNSDPNELQNIILAEKSRAYNMESLLRTHIQTISANRTAEDLGCAPVYGDQCK